MQILDTHEVHPQQKVIKNERSSSEIIKIDTHVVHLLEMIKSVTHVMHLLEEGHQR